MAKRKINDLGYNECIHCPTEESVKKIVQLATSTVKNTVIINLLPDGVVIYYNWVWDFLKKAKERWSTIYPRTDFIDEVEEEKEKPSDTVEVKSEVSRPWEFRTGDRVDGKKKCSSKLFQYWVFLGYTTRGTFLLDFFWEVGEFVECRFHIPQHKITCTEEVLEKVKQIEWVIVD